VTPSEENPNQLPAPNSAMRTIEQTPATASVKAGTSVLTDIGDSVITERAESIRYSNDEAMIWQETPSMALLLPRVLRYAIFLIIIFVACGITNRILSRNPATRFLLEHSGIRVSSTVPNATRHAARKLKSSRRASTDDAAATAADESTPSDDTTTSDTAPSQGLTLNGILLWIKLGFTALFALLLAGYWFKLKTTKYCASSQRLIVEEGALHSVNRPYELHQLGDAVIHKPALLRMFGVSNLEFVEPHIELYGLRNAEYVRDILRQGGQIEAQRADKIRWR
jgi:hypothetical protein